LAIVVYGKKGRLNMKLNRFGGWFVSLLLVLLMIVGQALASIPQEMVGQQVVNPDADPSMRYVKKVGTILQKKWIPPRPIKPIDCAVVTQFDVNLRGRMSGIKLNSTTCSPEMTQAALTLLQHTNKLPKPPILPKHSIRIEFTFAYIAKISKEDFEKL
jgi:TonB C terminal